MTTDELCKKIDNVLTRCAAIELESMQAIEDVIHDPGIPDKNKIVWKLEYYHRINGGPSPHLIILSKMMHAHPEYDFKIQRNVDLVKRK